MRADLNILLDIIREKSGCDFVRTKAGRRKRAVTDPRFKFAYVARHRLGASCRETAGAVGWKNHSTSIFAVRQVEGFLCIYPEWRRSIAEIEDELEFRLAAGMLVYAND